MSEYHFREWVEMEDLIESDRARTPTSSQRRAHPLRRLAALPISDDLDQLLEHHERGPANLAAG